MYNNNNNNTRLYSAVMPLGGCRGARRTGKSNS